MNLTVHCDGGSRGNPGPAACAFVIKNGEEELHAAGVYLGITTNNVAEYSALIESFKWITLQKDIASITFVLDSELVVKQMQGLYKIKSPLLIPLVMKVKAYEKELSVPITYRHVLRNENTHADLLVNQTLDSLAS